MRPLLEMLRSRAFDPAWRFDEAPVPVDWATRRFGEVFRQGLTFRSDGMVLYPAGAAEALEYYRDAPRGPLHPPATVAQVDNAERQIERPLPELLRRLYTEVADGGFGPGARGFARIEDVAALHRRGREHGLPESWFELTPGGCTMYWYADLSQPGSPVLLYDADGWDPRDGQRPEDGVHHVTPSLEEWLSTWAEGGDIWAAALTQ
ncbi:SMI1/KNR4 family protein [Paractinoplanes atraurantiacus]|uniref:SMI1 / KNR4 family (SUKH-1) n=1 Tax=Paractinoplanes atraurantiacus TaxID=1036182 RepID=A0A285IKT1_9ACTN|nr:SMI1/KNR4 family protein [Actinoplanes atraurantiacus]SNY48562.1 hypothetical protein SAMN05421748_10930 [Actinoplanes atraurantiacus]